SFLEPVNSRNAIVVVLVDQMALQKDKSVAGIAALCHGSGGPFVLPKSPSHPRSAAARHHLPALAARSPQRVIRIVVLFAALHESAFGPVADILFMPLMSPFLKAPKPDMPIALMNVYFED